MMPTDPKIRPDHLRRQAVVYVRQSTLQQVRGNRESSTRQYALADRAKALGWPPAAVQTIDDDQGRSGAHADHRHGFKKLLAEIGAGPVVGPRMLSPHRLTAIRARVSRDSLGHAGTGHPGAAAGLRGVGRRLAVATVPGD
jgi:hypothetical protein